MATVSRVLRAESCRPDDPVAEIVPNTQPIASRPPKSPSHSGLTGSIRFLPPWVGRNRGCLVRTTSAKSTSWRHSCGFDPRQFERPTFLSYENKLERVAEWAFGNT